MLKVGDKITIRYSKKLAQQGHTVLINRIGQITKIIYSNHEVSGVYADVKVNRKIRNYYIPVASIEGCVDINKLRVLSILKSTIF